MPCRFRKQNAPGRKAERYLEGGLRPSRGRVWEGKRVHVGLFLAAGGALVFIREQVLWWDGQAMPISGSQRGLVMLGACSRHEKVKKIHLAE